MSNFAVSREEIQKRLNRFVRDRKRRHMFFNVDPRFSGGSGAMVDMKTAFRTAEAEIEFHQDSLDGLFGDEEKENASQLGLSRIVELFCEEKKHWLTLDLITGEHHTRPFGN